MHQGRKELSVFPAGKTVKGGRRKGGESANLGEVSSRLAGHNEEFLLCFKAKRSHWKI